MKTSVYSLMNNIKWANILSQGSQKEKKKGKKILFVGWAENFHNLRKETGIHIRKDSIRWTHKTHTKNMIKISKVKDKETIL